MLASHLKVAVRRTLSYLCVCGCGSLGPPARGHGHWQRRECRDELQSTAMQLELLVERQLAMASEQFYLFYQRPWRRDKLCKRGFRIRLDCLLYCSMYGAMQFYLRRGNTFAKFCFPTNFHLSASSISSKDLPLVSGMSTAHTNAVRNVHPANRKYASKLLVDNKIGVVNATRKLVDQLLPCARLVADARVRCGWISAA